MCLERMWQNQLESYFLAKNCFETLRLIGPHLDDPPEAAAMTISSSSSYKVLKPMMRWRIRPKIMTSTAMMERSSRWAKRAAGRKTRTASRLSAGFPKLQFWFQRSGTWKRCSSKLIHGMMKNANVYRKEGWETGKYRTYRNVSECIGQKMELYMYNSKKLIYTCITRKKWNCTCITRKKWSYTFLYIPIHFIVLVGFGAKVFESP